MDCDYSDQISVLQNEKSFFSGYAVNWFSDLPYISVLLEDPCFIMQSLIFCGLRQNGFLRHCMFYQ